MNNLYSLLTSLPIFNTLALRERNCPIVRLWIILRCAGRSLAAPPATGIPAFGARNFDGLGELQGPSRRPDSGKILLTHIFLTPLMIGRGSRSRACSRELRGQADFVPKWDVQIVRVAPDSRAVSREAAGVHPLQPARFREAAVKFLRGGPRPVRWRAFFHLGMILCDCV